MDVVSSDPRGSVIRVAHGDFMARLIKVKKSWSASVNKRPHGHDEPLHRFDTHSRKYQHMHFQNLMDFMYGFILSRRLARDAARHRFIES